MTKDELYKQVKQMNPTWSDEQIWTQVSVMLSAEDVITKTPDPTISQDLLKTVLEKARNWLEETLPEIFGKVCEFIDDLISRIPDWAKDGLRIVFKLIENYLNRSYYGY